MQQQVLESYHCVIANSMDVFTRTQKSKTGNDRVGELTVFSAGHSTGDPIFQDYSHFVSLLIIDGFLHILITFCVASLVNSTP